MVRIFCFVFAAIFGANKNFPVFPWATTCGRTYAQTAIMDTFAGLGRNLWPVACAQQWKKNNYYTLFFFAERNDTKPLNSKTTPFPYFRYLPRHCERPARLANRYPTTKIKWLKMRQKPRDRQRVGERERERDRHRVGERDKERDKGRETKGEREKQMLCVTTHPKFW